jgi:hypothetical protein
MYLTRETYRVPFLSNEINLNLRVAVAIVNLDLTLFRLLLNI